MQVLTVPCGAGVGEKGSECVIALFDEKMPAMSGVHGMVWCYICGLLISFPVHLFTCFRARRPTWYARFASVGMEPWSDAASQKIWLRNLITFWREYTS